MNEFFARLKTIWGAGRYNQQWPTDAEERFSKRDWAAQIIERTPEEIEWALDNAKIQMMEQNPDFKFPSPEAVLSGCKRHLNASHKENFPLLPSPSEDSDEGNKRFKENMDKLFGRDNDQDN